MTRLALEPTTQPEVHETQLLKGYITSVLIKFLKQNLTLSAMILFDIFSSQSLTEFDLTQPQFQ